MQNKKYIKGIESAVRKAYTKVKKAPNFIDMNDFKEMIINPKAFNIGNEAVKHHIILYGVEEYYQLLNKARKR